MVAAVKRLENVLAPQSIKLLAQGARYARLDEYSDRRMNGGSP